MVEQKLPKLTTRVRFPSPAPIPNGPRGRLESDLSLRCPAPEPQRSPPRRPGSIPARCWPSCKRRVAFRTESQDPARAAALASYLNEEIGPSVARSGFEWAIWPNPVPGAPPLLFAERREDDALPDGADLRPRRCRRRLRRAMERTDARRGIWRSPTASGTAAARPTTRASTRSIWPHSRGSSPAAAGSASMPNCCSKWARRSARRACA